MIHEKLLAILKAGIKIHIIAFSCQLDLTSLDERSFNGFCWVFSWMFLA